MLNLFNENGNSTRNETVSAGCGRCVILDGGPGCGQRAITGGLIPIDAEVYGYDDCQPFIDKTREEVEMKGKEAILPDVIFDVTGSKHFGDFSGHAKELGYEVCLVCLLPTVEYQLKVNEATGRSIKPAVAKSAVRNICDDLWDFPEYYRHWKKDWYDEVWTVILSDTGKQPYAIYKLSGIIDGELDLDVKPVNVESDAGLSDVSLRGYIQSQYDKIPVEETTLSYRANYYYGDD